MIIKSFTLTNLLQFFQWFSKGFSFRSIRQRSLSPPLPSTFQKNHFRWFVTLGRRGNQFSDFQQQRRYFIPVKSQLLSNTIEFAILFWYYFPNFVCTLSSYKAEKCVLCWFWLVAWTETFRFNRGRLNQQKAYYPQNTQKETNGIYQFSSLLCKLKFLNVNLLQNNFETDN